MHGLMSLWFAPLIELEADLGYFYLCPSCHDEVIVPELERIQNRILELHPAAQRHLDELEEDAASSRRIAGDSGEAESAEARPDGPDDGAAGPEDEAAGPEDEAAGPDEGAEED